MHGILGTQANWRSISRRVIRDARGWDAILVDLREHGLSRALPGPPSLEQAARDLDGLTGAPPVRGVLGHSFGGKVALAYAAAHPELDHVWVVDSNPGQRPDGRGAEETVATVAFLRTLLGVYEDRAAFVARIVASGRDEPFAQWIAMNLREDGPRLTFDLDLDAIEQMLASYFETDLWHVLEHARATTRFHVIIGARSPTLDADDRARLHALAARDPQHIDVTVFPNAGHWVHADAPHELLALLHTHLSASPHGAP